MSSLWLVGFRPFFALGAIAGVFFPVLWALIFSGVIPVPSPSLTAVQWHAHEMFYGFGWAVLGGFLLTSTKNWVSIRGYYGGPLILLALAWIVERGVINLGFNLTSPLVLVVVFVFLSLMVGMLLWTLVRYRQQDSYADNVFFIALLPCFLFAKYQLLVGDFSLGVFMTQGLFRLAFLLMLERTLTQFMKGIFQVAIWRHPWLDNSIKSLALILVFAGYFPSLVGGLLSLWLALLLLLRLARWYPGRAFTRIDIGIMYVGYLAIVLSLLLNVLINLGILEWSPSVATHVFTLGAIGGVVPAMIIRISKGHTGRKVVFDGVDRAVLYLVLLAFFVRVGGALWLVEHYTAVVHLTATLWMLAFGVLAWRYIPFLLQPRVDGKTH